MNIHSQSIEQALTESVKELVRCHLKDFPVRAPFECDLKALEQRLVKIGIELYAPSITLMAGINNNFDARIAELISLSYIEETFQRIVKNKTNYITFALNEIHAFITTKFPTQSYSIKLQFPGSDAHNLGRETMFFNIVLAHSEEKYVFKPSCCATQRVINSFISEVFHDKICETSPIQKIEAHENGNYCIKKFIKAECTYDESDTPGLMFALGMIMCISLYTKATDLHFENIIVANGMPYIIDGEIILDDTLPDHSEIVLHSGILQYLHYAMNEIYHFTNIEANMLNNELSFLKTIEYTHHSLNKKNSTLLDNKKSISALVDGFAASFTLIKSQRKHLIDTSTAILHEKGIKLRYLPRFTAFYKITQLLLWTPFPQSTTMRVSEVQKRLLSHTLTAKKTRNLTRNIHHLTKAEISDFEEGDLPFFWVNRNGALCHRTGVISKNHSNPPATTLERTIRDASAMSLNKTLIPKLTDAFKSVARIIEEKNHHRQLHTLKQ